MGQADGDAYWKIVTDLQKRGTEDIFRSAIQTLSDSNPWRRVFAVDVLAQFDWMRKPNAIDRPFRMEIIQALAQLLEKETDVDVLCSCGSAFGHLADHQNPPALLNLSRHPVERVREKVAIAIKPSVDQPESIEAALALSCDASARVREWPLLWFSDENLARHPPIQKRLIEALGDDDFTCRAEAMCGLAAVKWGNIRAIMQRELDSPRFEDDGYGRGRLEQELESLD